MLNFENTTNAFASRSDFELKKAKILFAVMANPTLTKLGGWITPKFLWLGLVRNIIKKTIYNQFCGGETIEEAAHTAQILSDYKVSSLLDYGAEGKETEIEFEEATHSFIAAIEYACKKNYIPFISIKLTAFTRNALLEKMHRKEALNEAETIEMQAAEKRLLAICTAGKENNTTILIDAEESWIQDPVDAWAMKMMQSFNKEKAIVYNTYQLYRHDRLAFLKENTTAAQSNNFILGAKIVRGAYMEKERARASQKNYESPIQINKEHTDRDYNLALQYCLDNNKYVATFIGTHNEQSCKSATEIMEHNNISKEDKSITFSQLYGMSDNISFNLAVAGYQVSKYMPYGPVKDVIPYLLRRANENTSVAGQTTRELDLIKKELERRKNAKKN